MQINAITVQCVHDRTVDLFRVSGGLRVVHRAQLREYRRHQLDQATMEVALMVYGPSRRDPSLPAATNSMIYEVRVALCSLGMGEGA